MSARCTAFVLITSVLILVTACAGTQPTLAPRVLATVPAPTETSFPPTATPLPAASPTPASPQTIRNVSYIADGHPKQKLDIYLPAGSGQAFPTLFAIHGGGGDKSEFSRLAAYLVERGYALVSINYREMPQVRYPAPLEDAFCALAWMQTNARTYNLDTGRVFAVGHSLGGTLAAMLAVIDDPSDHVQDCPYSFEPHSLQGCVAFTGMFDYTAVANDPNTRLREYFSGYLGADLDQAPELWAQASPTTWLDGSDPPFLLIHGLGDRNVSPDYSTSFADKLRKVGVGVELLLIPDADHMGIIGSQKSFEAVEAFLASPPKPGAAATPSEAKVAHVLGDTWTRPADDMVMVYVPAGKFKMGINREGVEFSQQLCKQYGGELALLCTPTVFADEQPAHTVTLDSFWIDRTEVTNEQYRRCVEAGTCAPPVELGSYTRDSYYADSAYADYPVIWVTRDQAAAYCTWAGGRLPSEAEWEYAARGPEGLMFPWGNTFDGTRLNYCDASCAAAPKDETLDDGYPETAPVGSFPSGVSWCGALDLAGNVREWVADWYADYPHKPEVNPSGPASGDSRIPRGGCWLDTPDSVRSTNRGGNSTDYTRHKVGFRCAVDAGAPMLVKD